ncbi:hypothetical protein LPJ57_004233, partial [Coemansia sp. RSA 486]
DPASRSVRAKPSIDISSSSSSSWCGWWPDQAVTWPCCGDSARCLAVGRCLRLCSGQGWLRSLRGIAARLLRKQPVHRQAGRAASSAGACGV